MRFHIETSPAALEQLESLKKREQAILLDAIEQQLRHTPTAATRNRKAMRSNFIATWELRVGNFRVYCDVDLGERLVYLRAIGIKFGGRLFISGEDIELS